MNSDTRLNNADRMVGWAMLEAVRDDRGLSYLASTSIAQQANLHDVTVRASRRKLIELGYFEQVRAGGQNRATVCRPNHRLVEAGTASTASSVLLIQPVLGTFRPLTRERRPFTATLCARTRKLRYRSL